MRSRPWEFLAAIRHRSGCTVHFPSSARFFFSVHCLLLFCVLIGLLPNEAFAQPAISATKTDSLQVDADSDGVADPGDTIRYNITIGNSGASDATGVMLQDTLDANLTLGTVSITPVAFDDGPYSTVGNVPLAVDAADGVLVNDVDIDGNLPLTVVSFSAISVNGGNVAVDADGAFTYDPPLGFSGTDTFTYVVQDSSGLNSNQTGVVTLSVSAPVWFINSGVSGGANNGRFSSPFESMAAFNAQQGAGAGAPAAGHIIFVYEGSGTYGSGISLLNNQQLIGEGAGLTIAPNLSIPAGDDPVLGNAGGDVIALASGNTISGLTANPTTSAGIAGSGDSNTTITNVDITIGGAASGGVVLANHTGTLSFTGGSIAGNSTGDAVDINGGTAALTFTNVTIAKTGGRAVDIQNTTGGGATFTGGSITSTNGLGLRVGSTTGGQTFSFASYSASGATSDAIDLQNNAGGATITFNTLGAVAGRGILASSTGTVNVPSDAGARTISSTNNPALNIASTALNATFAGVTSTNSATTGVTLSTVTGTLTANGGSITGATGVSFDVSGGTVSSTYSGGITHGANTAMVSIANHTTGTITFQTGTLSATNGTGLQFNNADSTTSYNFNGTTTLNGGDAGIDITGGSAGTFTFGANASINNPSGIAYREDTSTANVTYNGTITKTNNANHAVDINAKTGGTTTFNGQIAATTTTANAVDLTNNTNGTIAFNPGGNGLDISTTSGVGFNATGGGTVTVQGAGNTIASTTGTALNVANTTIGANDLNFVGISANGATNGIILNTTGTSAGFGGLTVTGTGSTDGSGGTIQNTTGRGASFISSRDISLSNMNFTSAGISDLDADNSGLSTGDNLAPNAAIHLQSVTTVALDNLNITGGAEQGINGHNVNGFTLSNTVMSGIGNGPDEDGLHFYNMVGTCGIVNTSISTSGDDNVNIQNNTTPIAPPTSVATINVTGGSFNTGVLGSGLLFGIRGTSNATINVSGVTSNNNFSGGIVVDTFDTATTDLDVTTSTVTNNNDGIQVSGNNGTVSFDIHDNTNFSLNDFVVITVLKAAFSTGGTLQGRIRNNPITVANGNTTDAISVFNAGIGDLNLEISDNTFDYAGTQRVILLQTGQDGNGAINATVVRNLIDIKLDGAGNAVAGILAQSGITSPTGDGSSMCVDIGGAGVLSNTFTHSLGGSIAAGDIRVRQRNNGTARLPGYAGVATDTAAVIAYLGGRNAVVSTSTATADSTGFSGGAACVQPSP